MYFMLANRPIMPVYIDVCYGPLECTIDIQFIVNVCLSMNVV